MLIIEGTQLAATKRNIDFLLKPEKSRANTDTPLTRLITTVHIARFIGCIPDHEFSHRLYDIFPDTIGENPDVLVIDTNRLNKLPKV